MYPGAYIAEDSRDWTIMVLRIQHVKYICLMSKVVRVEPQVIICLNP